MTTTAPNAEAFLNSRAAFIEANRLQADREREFRAQFQESLEAVLGLLVPRIGLEKVIFDLDHEGDDQGGTYEVKSLTWIFRAAIPEFPALEHQSFRTNCDEHGVLFDLEAETPAIGDELLFSGDLAEGDQCERFKALLRSVAEAVGSPRVFEALVSDLNDENPLFSLTLGPAGEPLIELE